MDEELLSSIEGNPKYQALKRRRRRFGRVLTLLILVAYFGFIGLVAFDKSLLAQPVAGGVTSWGIPAGIGLILFAVALTAIYVVRANSHFDRLSAAVIEEATRP